MCLKSAYASEPAIVVSKPPPVASLPKKLCCASSAESLEDQENLEGLESQNPGAEVQSGPTLIKIKNTETGCDLQAADARDSPGANTAKPCDGVAGPPPETPQDQVLSAGAGTPCFPAQHRHLAADQNITFGQFELAALTPLHIDSIIFEPGPYSSPPGGSGGGSFCAAAVGNSSLLGQSEDAAEQVNCSKLIEALDIHSPAVFKRGVSSGLQSTPYKLSREEEEEEKGPGAASETGTVASAQLSINNGLPEVGSQVQNQLSPSARSPETEKRRVADHIHHFNKLTLNSPRASRLPKTRSALKFQRTPVRQTVCRINSLLGESRRCGQTPVHMVKAVSLESGLSPRPQLQPVRSGAGPAKRPPPPVPPKRSSTLTRKPKAGTLGDITNQAQPKSRADPAGAQKAAVQLVEKDMNHYRGSPRNPLNQARLLSATRPVDL